MEQGERDGIEGLDATTYGALFGMDMEVQTHPIGVSGSYANSNVEGDGVGASQLDISSYQITLYGDQDQGPFFVEAYAGYARNRIKSARQINFGTLALRTAEAEYDSRQYILGANGGIDIDLSGDLTLTPEVGLTWTRVITDDYAETGAGGISQQVSIDDIDILQGDVSATLSKTLAFGYGELIPEASLGIGYDFAGDQAVATALRWRGRGF